MMNVVVHSSWGGEKVRRFWLFVVVIVFEFLNGIIFREGDNECDYVWWFWIDKFLLSFKKSGDKKC